MHYAIPTYTVYGGGWGHGIGLSQYGSEGLSSELGWDYERIVTHYFQGTQLRTLSSLGEVANPYVKVNIDSDYGGSYTGRTYWSVRGHGTKLQITDGTDSIELTADTYHTIRGGYGDIYVDSDGNGSMGGSEPRFESPVSIVAVSGSPKLVVIGTDSGPFDLDRLAYRGEIRIGIASGSTWRVSATNVLPLEQYLYGVVPREMPSSWSAEALKAQSVAARSYAWASNPPSGGSDTLSGTLHCTAASQVYGAAGRLSGGVIVSHETAKDETKATAGRVVHYAPTDTIVQTFFSSSTGGFTANIEDVWTGATPRPYYTGVSDSYDYVRGNPYASWTREFTGLALASRLAASSYTWAPPGAGSSVWVSDVEIERGPSGYPKWTTFTFSTGATTVESSWDVRQALSLPSPNFLFGTVPVERYYGSDRYQTAVAIAGEAFPGTAPAAVIARGDDFADALVGSAVAGAAGGPLLLAAHDSLSGETVAYLRDLDPSTVYIMGGESALDPRVDTIVANATGATVTRIAGSNRYETAADAAAVVEGLGGGDTAIVVNGESWADAAAASGLAWARAYPILLVRRTSIPDDTRGALQDLATADVIAVGGDAVMTASVRNAAAGYAGGSLTHLSGGDRYATSAAVARHSVQQEGFSATTLYLATGEVYVDALTGGTLSGFAEHPLTLTMADRIKPGTESLLERYKGTIGLLGILGGPGAIEPGCIDEAQLILAE